MARVATAHHQNMVPVWTEFISRREFLNLQALIEISMKEQLYTVTAKNSEGESFKRENLTYKKANGLMADMRTWGVKDLCMVSESLPSDIEPDIEEGHRHAVQICVLFIVATVIVIRLIFAALVWVDSMDDAEQFMHTTFDFTPFLPK